VLSVIEQEEKFMSDTAAFVVGQNKCSLWTIAVNMNKCTGVRRKHLEFAITPLMILEFLEHCCFRGR
jgi:hypothetical protein